MPITISGSVHTKIKDNTIHYIAARGCQRNFSFAGSGLPFANQEQAFHNTPNKGTVQVINGKFTIELSELPSNYMTHLGSILVPPTLYVQYYDMHDNLKTVNYTIDQQGIPYRHLTYPSQRNNVSFYETQFKLWPRSQEHILRSSEYKRYPGTPPYSTEQYWGLRPPY